MFVRELTVEEREALAAGLKGRDGFKLRRCQILLASGRGEHAPVIARAVGCCPQTARNVIAAFNERGLASLAPASCRPRTGPGAAAELEGARLGKLQEMLHQSPRNFGKPRGTWTLELAARVAHELGLTKGVVSTETVRRAVHRLGGGWKRAKGWITSPDPPYLLKKVGGTG